MKDLASLKIVFSLLDEFSTICRLKVNKYKTAEVFPVNQNSNLDNTLGITWKKDKFKSLGVWFTQGENEIMNLNLHSKLDEMKKIINPWSCRNLTLFGKVVILKTLVLSKTRPLPQSISPVNICNIILLHVYQLHMYSKYEM